MRCLVTEQHPKIQQTIIEQASEGHGVGACPESLAEALDQRRQPGRVHAKGDGPLAA